MTSNRARFSTADIAAALGERSTRTLPADWNCCGVSTDTRTLTPGAVFVALRGPNFDGHEYVAAALQNGAGAAIIEEDRRSQFGAALPLIPVPSPLTALGKLAGLHRRRFDIPVVAIAGSAGKTTVKEMTACVIAQRHTTLKSEGNYNNRIGAPLSILRINEAHTAAVIEIGTNEPGEVADITAIVAPTHGLITNIGKEHLEKLVDLDGVAREETALFRWLLAHSGAALVNACDPRLAQFGQKAGSLSFALDDCNVQADVTACARLNNKTEPELRLRFRDKEQSAHIASPGRISALNALSAATCGFALGLSLDEVCAGLATYRPDDRTAYGRLRIEQRGAVTVLNDCYNANPASMNAALDILQDMNAIGAKYAVLGDMLELGAASDAEHDAIVERAAAGAAADLTLIVGEEMRKAFLRFAAERERVLKVALTAGKTDCARRLASLLQPGDILLIKGSRGLRLETILEESFAVQ